MLPCFRFGLLALCDVNACSHQTPEFRSKLGTSARGDPSRASICANHTKFFNELPPGAERLIDRVLHAFTIIRMDGAQEIPPVRCLTRHKTEQLSSPVRKPYLLR